VEIKCQLDATGVFIADLIACSICFGHHYAHHQELKSIIQWLLPVVFRAVVFKLLVWCGAEGYVSGLQDAAASKFSHLSLTLNCEMQQSGTLLRINTVTSGGNVLLSIHVAIRYILLLTTKYILPIRILKACLTRRIFTIFVQTVLYMVVIADFRILCV